MPTTGDRRRITKRKAKTPSQPTPLLTYRMARTLSQDLLATAAGVSQQTIAKYEKGKMVPPPNQRARLAAILGTSSEVLWPLGQLSPFD